METILRKEWHSTVCILGVTLSFLALSVVISALLWLTYSAGDSVPSSLNWPAVFSGVIGYGTLSGLIVDGLRLAAARLYRALAPHPTDRRLRANTVSNRPFFSFE